MVKRIKNESGNGIVILFILILLLGVGFIKSQFFVGLILSEKLQIQTIIDKGTSRASIDLKVATSEDLEKLGDGIGFDNDIAHEKLVIDRDKSKQSFFRVLALNHLNLKDEQIILLTPINLEKNNGDFKYTIYLEGKENTSEPITCSSLESLKTTIQSYLSSKNKQYSLNMDTNTIDKPTYLAVIEYDSGSESKVINSFGGSQTFRVNKR